ncbi:anti-sigma factor antagonist [Paenibacillus sp. FSL H7-0331]|uniref:anti-sigma factor antagonist n=2 Tax=Paenibacillus sp. FSL H7-0331 TaxID=1920421 RepID=UPI0030F92362
MYLQSDPTGGTNEMVLPLAETLSMKVRYSGSVIILELNGDLTIQFDVLLSRFRDSPRGLETEKRALILNFYRVSSSTGGGIAVLLRLIRERAIGNLYTFMCGLSTYLERLFRIVGLTQYAMVYPDEYTILQRLKEAAE